jgi:molecular chaperone GrpE
MTERSKEKHQPNEKKKPKAEVVPDMEPVKDEMKEAKELADHYLAAAQRIQADFDNYRKRSAKEMEELRKHAVNDLIAETLGTVDDLDRALAITDEDTEFIRGIKSVRQNLMKMLASRGVEEIPTDRKFNSGYHEALSAVEGEEDGDIVEVYQKGYTCGDRVLRYSKVKVTKASDKECLTARETAKYNKEE